MAQPQQPDQQQSRSNGFDRFNDALRGLDDQVQELRDRFDDQRRKVEDEFRKRSGGLQTRLRKSPLYRRAKQIREEVEEQVERSRSQVYSLIGLVSRSELEKIDRKLNTLSRKLNELVKEKEKLQQQQ